MRFLFALSLLIAYNYSYGQSTPSGYSMERIKVPIKVEVNGCPVGRSISQRQLIDEGFSLKTENSDYTIKGFCVVIPCQSRFIFDLIRLKFIGNIAPHNHRGLKLLRVGEHLNITSIIINKEGRDYITTGIILPVTDEIELSY